jgi:hypothetical protein
MRDDPWLQHTVIDGGLDDIAQSIPGPDRYQRVIVVVNCKAVVEWVGEAVRGASDSLMVPLWLYKMFSKDRHQE